MTVTTSKYAVTVIDREKRERDVRRQLRHPVLSQIDAGLHRRVQAAGCSSVTSLHTRNLVRISVRRSGAGGGRGGRKCGEMRLNDARKTSALNRPSGTLSSRVHVVESVDGSSRPDYSSVYSAGVRPSTSSSEARSGALSAAGPFIETVVKAAPLAPRPESTLNLCGPQHHPTPSVPSQRPRGGRGSTATRLRLHRQYCEFRGPEYSPTNLALSVAEC